MYLEDCMKLRRYAYLFLGVSLGLANAVHAYAAGNYAFAKSGSIGGEDTNIVDTETVGVSTEEELEEVLKNYQSVKLKNDIELTK